MKISPIKNLFEIDNKTHDYFQDNLENILKQTTKNLYLNKELKEFFIHKPNDYLRTILISHIYFINEAYYIKNEQVVLEHIRWEVNTYKNIDIPDIFYQELILAILKVLNSLDGGILQPIIKFYQYLLENIDKYINSDFIIATSKKISNLQEIYYKFEESLLEPSLLKAIEISKNYIKNKKDLYTFWIEVLVPALHNIGLKWAEGDITVGQEHTATSICQRVMSIHYETILTSLQNKKKFLVTTSLNELHQVAARMVSDLIELNGYEVFYFTPKDDLSPIIKTIKDEEIKDILISTTLVSNLGDTRKMIEQLRKNLQFNDIKIYVGGQAYLGNEKAHKLVNADYYISDINKFIESIQKGEQC